MFDEKYQKYKSYPEHHQRGKIPDFAQQPSENPFEYKITQVQSE
jgi:hypothetical protein